MNFIFKPDWDSKRALEHNEENSAPSQDTPDHKGPVKQKDFFDWGSESAKSEESEQKKQSGEKTGNAKPSTKNKKSKTNFDF